MNDLKVTIIFLSKIGSILITLISFYSNAEVLRWPNLCQNPTLIIENLTTTETQTWLQKFKGSHRQETSLYLASRQKIQIELNPELQNYDGFSLLHLNPILNSVKVESFCDLKKFPANNFEGGILTFRRSDLTEPKLILQNLAQYENNFKIELLNQFNNVIDESEVLLKISERRSYKPLIKNKSWKFIRVKAEHRFTAFNLSLKGSENPIQIKAQKSQVNAAARYFLMSPRDGKGDSFTIKITEPEMIEKALDLIQNPQQEKMLFAKIEKGSQGFNRNFHKLEKSFWSWSTTEVTHFEDIGSTACNGLPQQVEDDVDLWVQNPGRICFWNYRIKKEIPVSEVESPK